MSIIDYTIIMHISDMHFGIPDKRQTASNRKYMQDTFIDCYEKLFKSHPNWVPDILVVSGDIAWSGASEDYKMAEEFFKRFLKIANSKITPSDVVICFGNHDVYADPYMRLVEDQSNLAYDTKLDQHVKRPLTSLKDGSEIRALNDKFALMTEEVEKYYHRFENAENFCNTHLSKSNGFVEHCSTLCRCSRLR